MAPAWHEQHVVAATTGCGLLAQQLCVMVLVRLHYWCLLVVVLVLLIVVLLLCLLVEARLAILVRVQLERAPLVPLVLEVRNRVRLGHILAPACWCQLQ